MLTEGARKIYHGRHGARGRRVGQGWFTPYLFAVPTELSRLNVKTYSLSEIDHKL
jgi:hypothetical protein